VYDFTLEIETISMYMLLLKLKVRQNEKIITILFPRLTQIHSLETTASLIHAVETTNNFPLSQLNHLGFKNLNGSVIFFVSSLFLKGIFFINSFPLVTFGFPELLLDHSSVRLNSASKPITYLMRIISTISVEHFQ